MIDFELLNKKIRDSGMTMVAIAKKSGMLRETLYSRLKGETEFKLRDVTNLSRTLKLTDEDRNKIFFANES